MTRLVASVVIASANLRYSMPTTIEVVRATEAEARAVFENIKGVVRVEEVNIEEV